jgi:PAS domain S-box-containing protein
MTSVSSKAFSSSNALEEINKFRERLLDGMILSFAILGFLPTAIGVWRALLHDHWELSAIYLSMYGCACALAVLRKRFSFRLKVWVGATLIYLQACAVLLLFGLGGAGTWFLLVLSVFATVIYGTWFGLFTTIASMILVAFVGALMSYGVLSPHAAIWLDSTYSGSWILGLALFSLLGFAVVIGPGMLQHRLQATIETLHRRNQDLRKLNLDLTHEVGERRKAEVDLIESREYLALITNEIPAYIAHISHDERLLYLNRSLAEFFGKPQSELIGTPLADLLEKDQMEIFHNHLQNVFGGSRASFHVAISDSAGKSHVISVNLVPDIDNDGSVSACFAMGQDVTQRHELQRRLQESQKLEAIGRLAGGVAHDFNNMLTGVSGSISLLQMQHAKEDPIQEPLNEIDEAMKRSSDLVRQLLAFSSHQVIKPRIINLNDLIDEMDRMLRRLIGEDIELVTECGSDILPIAADPGQVEQILVNLAVNARDAMVGGGRLTITTHGKHLDAETHGHDFDMCAGDYTILTVSDTGHGMDNATQERIFEPFFTTKRNGKGTGLGLATIYGIIRQHNAFIDVESAPGQGTTFTVSFPATTKPLQSIRPVVESGELPCGHEAVLIVEDDHLVKNIAIKILRRQGYTVFSAENGELALDVLHEHAGQIDLLLTDVIMPIMNGKELVDAVQATWPAIRILYTSGYTADVIGRHGVLSDGQNFLPKPYSPRSLAQKVRDVLDQEYALATIGEAFELHK